MKFKQSYKLKSWQLLKQENILASYLFTWHRYRAFLTMNHFLEIILLNIRNAHYGRLLAKMDAIFPFSVSMPLCIVTLQLCTLSDLSLSLLLKSGMALWRPLTSGKSPWEALFAYTLFPGILLSLHMDIPSLACWMTKDTWPGYSCCLKHQVCE